MIQLIDNVMIIQLQPEDKNKGLAEIAVAHLEEKIRENVHLRLELERIKEAQRLMQFAWQG